MFSWIKSKIYKNYILKNQYDKINFELDTMFVTNESLNKENEELKDKLKLYENTIVYDTKTEKFVFNYTKEDKEHVLASIAAFITLSKSSLRGLLILTAQADLPPEDFTMLEEMVAKQSDMNKPVIEPKNAWRKIVGKN